MMSRRTSAVAVAVRAMVTGQSHCSRTSPRRLYSGRKSCPQEETQWASSTTKSDGLSLGISAEKSPAKNRSGATYSKPSNPASISSMTRRRWAAESVLFKTVAGIPSSRSCCTWSSIRLISGETTTTSPFLRTAGSW
jgi:hypothetical protein